MWAVGYVLGDIVFGYLMAAGTEKVSSWTKGAAKDVISKLKSAGVKNADDYAEIADRLVDSVADNGDDLARQLDDANGVRYYDGSSNAGVNADVRKFSEYIFKDGVASGKDVVFKNMGYDINDSEVLINLYKEQAVIKYAKGEYTLGKADSFGQRINIEIELPGIGDATGQTSYLKSGWMINTDGSLSLNTPFSGFTR